MKKNKEFDCVEMKNRIQAQLSKDWDGKSNAEIREEIHKRMETSQTPIAQFWRRIRKKDAARSGIPVTV